MERTTVVLDKAPPRPGQTHTRTYDSCSVGADHDGKVAEVHLASHAVAQVSAFTADDGFLVRVWPPNGTHEYGGTNSSALSFAISFDDDGQPTLQDFNFWGKR
jgi:hypothetical protein